MGKYITTRNPHRGNKHARLKGPMQRDLRKGAVSFSRNAIRGMKRDSDPRTRAEKKAEGAKRAREASRRNR